jgi:hypothetical protein
MRTKVYCGLTVGFTLFSSPGEVGEALLFTSAPQAANSAQPRSILMDRRVALRPIRGASASRPMHTGALAQITRCLIARGLAS